MEGRGGTGWVKGRAAHCTLAPHRPISLRTHNTHKYGGCDCPPAFANNHGAAGTLPGPLPRIAVILVMKCSIGPSRSGMPAVAVVVVGVGGGEGEGVQKLSESEYVSKRVSVYE